MTMLSARGRVVPLDTLASPRGVLPLPANALLVLVQPLPFTPEENVSLDAWVRGGGRLLLFADPALTAPSQFALGDPRGPLRTAMLSPILRHWGLELRYDPAQPAGERQLDMAGVALTVDMAGRFVADKGARCAFAAHGVIADCHVGQGWVVAVGDAAVFDGDDAGRAAAFTSLLDRLRH